jgi:hypothetical protein
MRPGEEVVIYGYRTLAPFDGAFKRAHAGREATVSPVFVGAGEK